MRTFIRRIHSNEVEQDSSRHNAERLPFGVLDPRHRRRQGEPLLALFFGIARVADHSLLFLRMLTNYYARRGLLMRSQCHKKITKLLGGPFHSGAPRLCLPCLPHETPLPYMRNAFFLEI